MKQFKAGQTVYVVMDNFGANFDFSEPLNHWVESFHVTNDPLPPQYTVPYWQGRVSRHYLNYLIKHKMEYLIHGRVTRSKRKAMRWAKVYNQASGVNQ